MATIIKRGPYQWQAKIRKKGHKSVSKTFDYHVALRKKYRSLENELHKARAKMRRLTSSKRIRQKPDEEESWSE